MRDKNPADPEKSSHQKALEARIDAMLNADEPDEVDAAQSESKSATGAMAITVRRSAPSTAPAVPRSLLQEIPGDQSEKSESGEPDAASESPEISDQTDETDETPRAQSETVPIDDKDTDKAVDDIVAKEGDIVLAVEDAAVSKHNKVMGRKSTSWKDKLRGLAKNKRTWTAAAVVLVVLFAVPLTRYKILGLLIKQPVSLTIIDSKSRTPVSNAAVSLGGASGRTDGSGRVTLRAPVGKDSLTIAKQYYTTTHTSYFVGFASAPAASTNFSLVATGRLVPVTVINKITGKPLKGAEIKVLKTTAKTDAKGLATIALPADNTKDNAKISLAGYNPIAAGIEVTDKAVKNNTIELTPAGHIYFLSNLHGSLDVVKSNLDGSDRHVVLEGTGKEDKLSTSLLASRDWRYLVLKAKRDSDQAALYLIDTGSDKVTQFDNGNADFSLVGWYGHAFVYSLTRTALSVWQPGREVLKSYDAENLQLNQLDQSQAEGDASVYAYQSFSNFYIVNGAVAYNMQWYGNTSYYNPAQLAGKSNTIRAINPNGQNKKDYQSFDATSTSINQAVLYKPQSIYYAVYDRNQNKTNYYEYENQAVKSAPVDQNTFNQGYPTYLLSPSGNQTFWTELRDGRNTLFIGTANADNQKQIASLSDYSPYGWYSDNYTLVSKNSSELYIMPATGPSAQKPPLKITDYYKPAQTFNGYGYGYGGL